MYHSITFGNKNTWDDWHLIPTSRPYMELPEIKTNIIDIPGAYGSLDISESLVGHILYENRQGSLEFYIDHEYWKSWVDTFHTIASYLHGQRMKCILEDDPGYYYDGRFTVSKWSSEESYSKITIDYDVYPFKKELTERSEPWLWDPFDFEEGIIHEGYSKSFTGTYILTIDGTDEYIVPTFYCASSFVPAPTVTVEYNGVTKTLELGKTNIFPEWSISNGSHKFKFVTDGGHCDLTVHYQGGLL